MRLTCTVCEREQSAAKFYRDRTRSTGYTTRCKACLREMKPRKSISMTRQVYGLLSRVAQRRGESMSATIERLVRATASAEGVS